MGEAKHKQNFILSAATQQPFDLLVSGPGNGGRGRVVQHPRAHTAQQCSRSLFVHYAPQCVHHALVRPLEISLCL